MNRYLFLIAWVEGSDSAFDNNDGYNGVHGPDDLVPRFNAGEEDMLSALIEGAPNVTVAIAFGSHAALHENYTGYDSVSNCIKLNDDYVFPQTPSITIKVDLTPES